MMKSLQDITRRICWVLADALSAGLHQVEAAAVGCKKGPRKAKEKFFTWTDAWVFASLRGGMTEEGFNFASFLALGDALNHEIMSAWEIRQGLTKLYRRGLIEIEKENITTTDLAKDLYSKIDKKRGGAFSIIDNCFAVLNSPRTKLLIWHQNAGQFKLSDEDVRKLRAIDSRASNGGADGDKKLRDTSYRTLNE